MTEHVAKQAVVRQRNNQVFILSSIAWTVLTVVLCVLSYNQYFNSSVEIAVNAAMNSFEKDVVYRKWAAIHGGVYVPVSEFTPPNPYLKDLPNRDVETTTGLKLTLMNPAYMTRQVHEIGFEQHGLRGHITSLQPLRPENAPDEWERKALEQFNQGKESVWSFENIDNKTYVRLMRPFYVDSSCLKCHAHQGYKEGDVRGGISVAVPWDKTEQSIKAYFVNNILAYCLVWFVGMTGIVYGHRVLSSNIARQYATLEALGKSENTLKTVTRSMPLGTGLTINRVFNWINETFSEMTGYSKDELYGKSARILYENDEEFERVGAILVKEISASGQAEVETRFVRKDSTTFDVILRLASTERSDPTSGLVFSVIDISERKKSAIEMQENSFRLERAELAAKFGNWELDLNTRKMKGSKGALRIYGVEKDTYDIEEAQRIPLPEFRAALDQALRELIDQQKAYDLEFKARRQSDSAIIDIHSIADYNPSTGVVWGVIQDITEKKRAEEALKESEARYRVLAENMVDVIWQMSPDLKFTYVSPSISRQFGYSQEEMLGQSVINLMVPDSRKQAQQAFEQTMKALLEGGDSDSRNYELELTHKDGSRMWVEITSSPAFDDDGKLVGIQGVSRDITDRKNAERQLRYSEQLFRSYVESAPLGIWEADGNGTLVSANRAASEITGYSNEQLIGSNMLEICLPEQVPELALQFESLKRTANEKAEVQVVRPDGVIIWQSVNGVKLSDDRFLFFSQDVTARKSAEAELQRNANEMLLLIKSMINGFVVQESIFDESGAYVDYRVVFINDAYERLTGLKAEEVIGKTVYEIWPDTENQWVAMAGEVALTGNPKSFEMYHTPTKRFWSCNLYRPWDSADRICMIFDDITEKKRVQEEIIEMERRLFHAKKLESLGVLSGGIAHDFNNLLAIIIGNLELAADALDPSSEAITNIQKAMSAAERSASLTRQMLAYSGKSVLDVSEINLSQVIQQQTDMIKAVVAKTAHLELNLADDLPRLRGDTSEIQQVALNLITNASESLEGGPGNIWVTTGVRYFDEALQAKSLLHDKPAPQDMIFLEVRDDGVGMEHQTLDRLFDPFYTTKFLGRGLGMSVVHGVVKGHRGAITVETYPGEGTTVTVYFPISESKPWKLSNEQQSITGTQTSPKQDGEVTSGTVLVVDDEALVSDFMTTALSSFGFDTLKADNGRQAVEIFRDNKGRIDLVLLDLSMPEMDGVAAFEHIRKIRPDIKVILCSGYSEEEIIGRFDENSYPNAFLKKPSKLKDLKALVHSVLNRDMIKTSRIA